ncbi:RNA polymerase sigma factor [Novosphingobium fluoreni]|uniref:RNA polymerase sigma factor n=1 Tax=Novosphingobium fluoreni TaxID=1391222 RepID=UPI003DA10589
MTRDDLKWFGRNILPYEPDVRRWIRRSSFASMDEDDLIQEAYFRIARGGDLGRIRHGRAYFFSTVKNLLTERLRRERIVRFEAMAEIESLFILDDAVPVDEQIERKEELSIVMELMNALPERCRTIMWLRRVDGLSQREAAERLGVTENIVEKQTALALRCIVEGLAKMADVHGYLPSERRKHSVKRHTRR